MQNLDTNNTDTADKQELLNRAAGQEAISPQSGEAFVDWAIELLCQGETNMNVAMLAGLRQPLYTPEVMCYVHLAVRDLGLDLSLLTAPEALWYAIQDVARQIVAGEIMPYDGCQKFYEIYLDFEYERLAEYRYFSASLLNFFYLDDDYDNEEDSWPYRMVAKNDSREEIDRCVIEEANILLNSPMPIKK
jgi:hypothetical protein